ncbi:MAG TPA: hypothetical protein VMR62_15775 [Bryobacteraceae bacterium]|nr:hypothetical protein [Bryobacteraceae bacterium]
MPRYLGAANFCDAAACWASLSCIFFIICGRRSHSRDLPGNLHIRLVRGDLELMAGDLAAHYRPGKLADHGKLIAKVGIDGLKPPGNCAVARPGLSVVTLPS